MQVHNKHIIVTGGASGLGGACAALFQSHGANVTVFDQKPEAEVEAKRGQLYKQVDITKEAEVAEALLEAEETNGDLYGLVNCAGIGSAKKVLSSKGPHDLETFQKVIEVNLVGTFNMLRLAAEKMKSHEPEETGERGVIINTASIAAYDGQIGQAAYSASKGGIASLTLPAARELATAGIRVVAVAPGVFETPLFASVPEEARQQLEALTPFPKRLGDPQEFAELALHIFQNTMMNGETIRLDGAIRMP
ncbi:NAD(P)-dependent dehydrogenase (short-subunit alcohol dehydrogenase family) [Salsuginibacillus halophilus]|uniref:NAD(P)-dependent dehydrogenase (Short-subunit alcohol dehydrogenase family) n=1 Tax=Salsuginibacillus halophilus TaxID=517424 RepID=A0A2P8HQE6_9BACI|nr:SDR family NAD(P)-dependent oxidoreductase [Salsuginibacillus halophilus]PSL48443.1 NAD(P)-dependent dehydrogenase (short-subunit alcohol dehydrogenase family) [Salsuginibacillus halophilus]